MDIISEQNIKPNAGFLLLEVPDKPTETVSGVLLASDDNNSVPMMAKIIATHAESTYKVGEMVLFRKYSVDEIKVKDKEGQKTFWLLETENVLATIS